MASISSEQVLTRQSGSQSEIFAPDQSPKAFGEFTDALVASLLVSAETQSPSRADRARASPQQRGEGAEPAPNRRSRSPRRRKRGGWPSSACLSWCDVKEIDGIVHELAGLECVPTHLVTIMPLVGDDSSRKRACSREIAHLGQALKRHAQVHIGLTVFEHPLGADLHAHHLVHVPCGEYATVERRHRPPEVHVAKIDSLRETLEYLTKERRRLSPDFEAMIKRQWQRCQPVPGKRWSMTTDAREALAGESVTAPNIAKKPKLEGRGLT